MPLDDYETAADWADIIEMVTASREMPPSRIVDDGSCNEWQNSGWLSDEALETIATWIAEGAVPGPSSAMPAPLPPVEGITGETLDLFIPDPYSPVAIGGSDTAYDDYRCFLFEPDLDADTYVTAYEVVPGDPSIVHHIILYTVDASQLGQISNLQSQSGSDSWPCPGVAGSGVEISGMPVAWAPGLNVLKFPEGTGLKIFQNQRFVMQVHYNLINGNGPDQTGVKLEVASSVDRVGYMQLTDKFLSEGIGGSLPPGQEAVVRTWSANVNSLINTASWAAGQSAGYADIYGFLPHMHERGTQFESWLSKPATDEDICLGRIDDWDFNWQLGYWYAEPVRITKGLGEQITVTCTYDTTDETAPVAPGLGTGAEMCLLGTYVVLP